MNTFSHNNDLFMPSGCLSPIALEKYAAKQLSPEEMLLVDEHLASCALCRDAVEGASQIPDFAARSSAINERLRRRFRYIPGRSSRNPRLSNFLLPAAASVLVLLGIIAWFHYFYPEKQELALMTDTIHVQADEREVQDKKEAVRPEHDKGKAASIGGIMNREDDKGGSISDETVKEPDDKQQVTPPETVITENELIEDAEKEEVIKEEILAAHENAEAMEMGEKAVEGVTELDKTVAKKSVTATRQMKSSDGVFATIETEPEYPGGPDSLQSFIRNTLQYPEDVDPQSDTTVIASFIVTKKGKIRDIVIVQSAGKAFDDEVIRMIKLMPDWKPATQYGETVAYKYVLPIRFEGE